MSALVEETRAFKARKSALELDATRLVAFRLLCGIDLSDALAAKPGQAAEIIIRVERLVERERLKGLRRHWAYDLNRHIALKQALDQLRQAHGRLAHWHSPAEDRPWKTRRRPKAPSKSVIA
jgi:hypothetical protein